MIMENIFFLKIGFDRDIIIPKVAKIRVGIKKLLVKESSLRGKSFNNLGLSVVNSSTTQTCAFVTEFF